jgi:iron(III) transport system ATP-binding protein
VLVQSGSAEDVYHHPATPFVARFTGLAGELPVRVAGHGSDGALELTASGAEDGSVRLPALRPAAAGAAALKPGDDALLAIRPTGILLLRSAAEAPHLAGRVADVAFRGRGYEYAIDLPGLGRLTGVFARHRAERGDPAGLRLDPEGCHLFPADAKAEEKGTTSPAPALTA